LGIVVSVRSPQLAVFVGVEDWSQAQLAWLKIPSEIQTELFIEIGEKVIEIDLNAFVHN
jgi:hypothetical protein